MQHAVNNTEYDRADFKGLYKGGTLIESAEIRAVPWEIGRPQPAVCAILEATPKGTLLDVGCGLGRNANAAREFGHAVTAIDSAPDAVETARRRFAGIDFRVADACDTGLDSQFETILDSAVYHAIPSEQRGNYLSEMRRVATCDGIMHIVTFAPSTQGMPRPLAVDLSEICANAEKAGWTVRAVSRVEYKGNAEAIADFRRKKGLDIATDAEGFTRLPCWHVALSVNAAEVWTC